MPRYRTLQGSFTAGEVSPFAYGRANLELYGQSCRTLLNQIPFAKGGTTRRAGTEFIGTEFSQLLPSPASIREITDGARLIPFIISKTDSYILCILPNDLAPYSQTSGFDMFVARSTSKSTNIFGPDIMRLKLAFTQVSWIEAFAGVTIPNAKKFEGYAADELEEIQYSQKGDILVLTHPNHPPLFVQRLSNPASDIFADFFAYPFYMKPEITQFGTSGVSVTSAITEEENFLAFRGVNTNTNHTLDPSATTGTITVVSNLDFFDAGHIGAYFVFAGTGVFEITAVTDAQNATAEVIETLPNHTATSNWNEQAWSDYRGWPRTSAFFQQRLIYAANEQQSDTIWLSQTGDIYELKQPDTISNVSDPFQRTLDSDEVNGIGWLVSGKQLTIGTLGGEYLSVGASDGTAASTFGFELQTTYGSTPIKPARVNNVVTFLERNGRTVREFVFNFQEDSFQSRDLSQLADHMVDKAVDNYAVFNPPTIKELVYQGGEESIVWCRDSNGGLFGMTRNKEFNTVAWHYHILGGNLDDEPPKVMSMAIVPNRDGTHDDLYLVVKRTVNDETVYYIERVGDRYRLPSMDESQISDANFKPYFLDCASFTPGPKSGTDNTFVGFEHLKNETVDVLADGIWVGQMTVNSSGELVFDEQDEIKFQQVIAGYRYDSTIIPQVPEAGSAIGSGQTAVQRIDEVDIRFYQTTGCKYGRYLDQANLDDIIFRPADLNYDTPIPLFSGVKTFKFPGNYEKDDTLIVTTSAPFPMNVVSLSIRGQTNDG